MKLVICDDFGGRDGLAAPLLTIVPAVEPSAPATMTASEQMFFLGVPLAHVVAYEQVLRTKRVKSPMLQAGRFTKVAHRHACPCEPIELPLVSA